MEKFSAEEMTLAYQLLQLPPAQFEKAAALAGMSKEAFKGKILSGITRGLGALGRGATSPFRALMRGRTVKMPKSSVDELPWTMMTDDVGTLGRRATSSNAARRAAIREKWPAGSQRTMEFGIERGAPPIPGSIGSPLVTNRGVGDAFATGAQRTQAASKGTLGNAAAKTPFRERYPLGSQRMTEFEAVKGAPPVPGAIGSPINAGKGSGDAFATGKGTLGDAATLGPEGSVLFSGAPYRQPTITNIKSAPLPSGVASPGAAEAAGGGWKSKLPWLAGGLGLGYLGFGGGGAGSGLSPQQQYGQPYPQGAYAQQYGY